MGRLHMAALSLVTVVFAVGLSYASVELPLLVSSWLVDALDMPGYDSGMQFEHAEAFVAAHHLRPIGFVALTVVVLLMAVGLVMERRGPAIAGAVAVFLPVFGHFAASMFFLAGLGVLRILWLPVLDLSYRALSLGDEPPQWLSGFGRGLGNSRVRGVVDSKWCYYRREEFVPS